jgi:hypothetical protein
VIIGATSGATNIDRSDDVRIEARRVAQRIDSRDEVVRIGATSGATNTDSSDDVRIEATRVAQRITTTVTK